MLTREDFMRRPEPVVWDRKRRIGYQEYTLEDWLAKSAEEDAEICRAIRDGERPERIAEEIVDNITVHISWLYALGLMELLDRTVASVNEKNRHRGGLGGEQRA